MLDPETERLITKVNGASGAMLEILQRRESTIAAKACARRINNELVNLSMLLRETGDAKKT